MFNNAVRAAAKAETGKVFQLLASEYLTIAGETISRSQVEEKSCEKSEKVIA